MKQVEILMCDVTRNFMFLSHQEGCETLERWAYTLDQGQKNLIAE